MARLQPPGTRFFLRRRDLLPRHPAGDDVAVLLRICEPAFGAKGKPHMGEHQILRHAMTFGVKETEVVLRRRKILFRRHAVPLQRLGEVAPHAVTVIVHETEARLGGGITLFR